MLSVVPLHSLMTQARQLFSGTGNLYAFHSGRRRALRSLPLQRTNLGVFKPHGKSFARVSGRENGGAEWEGVEQKKGQKRGGKY